MANNRKVYLRWKGCRRKHKFATKEDALLRTAQLIAEKDVWLGVYKCRYCDGWHLFTPANDKRKP